jgi:glycine betaine/proline transport system ATP-binding protein
LQLDAEGRPVGCTLDGQAGSIGNAEPPSSESDAKSDILIAPIDLKMRSAIELRRRSGNPIVLVDQLGRLAGLCGDDEIYRALLQARRPEEMR